MASTYTTALRIELQADGENNNTWGQKANDVLDRLELAAVGYTAVPLSDANYTLSVANSDAGDDEASSYFLKFTGTLSANRNIVVPTAHGRWIIWNATSGGFDLVIKTAGGTGANCPPGFITPTASDGTNVYPTGPATSTTGDINLPGDLTVGDDITVTDDAAVGGDLAVTGDSTLTGTLGVTGATTLQTATIAKAVAFTGVITPSTLTGDEDDYAPSGHADATTIRIAGDDAHTITGLSGGAAGRRVVIVNIGNPTLTLTTDDSSSTASNRFLFTENVALVKNDSVALTYDATTERWRREVNSNIPAATTAVAGKVELATRTETQDASSSTVVPAVGSVQYHPGVAKAWVNFNGSDASIRDSHNISSVTRNSTGDYTVTFTFPFADTNYAWFVTAVSSSGFQAYAASSGSGATFTKAAGSIRFGIRDITANLTLTDVAQVSFVAFGTLAASL